MGQYGLLAKTPIGIFVFSDRTELLYFKFFSKNPEKAVEEYTAFRAEKIENLNNLDIIESDTAYDIMREKFRDFAKSLGFVQDDISLNRFLCDFGFHLSKKKMTGVIGRDRLVAQSVNALDDMKKVVNLFQERLYEWYSLHYPELRNTKGLHEKILSFGRRDNFPDFKGSIGVDLKESDETMLMEYASTVQTLIEEEERLENYVKALVKDVAPNLSSILDPILAARLISYAGSLEKLSRMPASTIQLLGAEKALFRHLKKKGKSPKYGLIFTSPIIQTAKPENRGKVARVLSSKLMFAARIDYYSGRHEPKLKQEMDEELKRI